MPPQLPPDLVPVSSLPDDLVPVTSTGDKLLDNSSADDSRGVLKNIGTGVAKMVTHIPGMIGDFNELGPRITSNVQSIFSDRTAPQIREDRMRARAKALDQTLSDPDMLDKVLGAPARGSQYLQAPTGEDIYKHVVKPVVGEYHPKTFAGQIGQIALESAMPGPGGKVGTGERILSHAPGLTEKALGIASKLKMPALGATMGATGAGVSELTGSPEAGLVASLAVPFAPAAARTVAPRAAERVSTWLPHSKEWAARKAAQSDLQITDPRRALATAEQRYAEEAPGGDITKWRDTGASPTIAEAAGDAGLAGTEQAVRLSGDANVDAALRQRMENRQTARDTQLRSTLDAAAKPEDVATFFRQRQQELDNALDTAVPRGARPEELGSTVKGEMRGGLEQDVATRRKLYDAIDPNGDLHIVSKATPKAAEELMKAYEQHKDVSRPPVSLPEIQMAQGLKGVVPFAKLRKLRETINEALGNARAGANPNFAAQRELKILKNAIDEDMQRAIANQQQRHLDEIRLGARTQGDTLASELSNFHGWLQRQQSQWRADRAAVSGAAGGQGPAAGAEPRPGAPHGDTTAAGAAGEGPAGGTAGARVAGAGEPPYVDPEAAERLATANAFHRYFKQMYGEGTVGQIMRPTSPVSDAAIPGKVFPGGDKGYETTAHVLQSAHGSPEAITAMGDIANASLRKVVDASGGRLTPQALDKWRNQYGGSLRAIEEAHPGFSDRYNNIANVQSELATQFTGFRDPTSASRALGRVARAPNGPQALRELLAESGASPDVREGLKHLMVNHLIDTSVGNAILPGSRQPMFSGVKFRANLRAMRPALEQLFSPEHMRVMDRLAADFESQFMHEQALKGPAVGSNTARNLELLEKRLRGEGAGASAGRDITLPLAVQTLATHGVGTALHMMGGMLGTKALTSLVQGFHNRNIRNMNDAIKVGMTDPEVGLKMLRHHANENLVGHSWATRVKEALDNSPYYALPAAVQAQHERRERASGGKVGVNHATHAAKLVSLVDKARKEITEQTKPLLKAHDTHIAQALELANGAI